MLMTLFCDASYCSQTKAAGWGAWAKCDGWPSGKLLGGGINRPLLNSSEAELCAIANAISYLQGLDAFYGVTAVIIQSDSLRALGLLAASGVGASISNHDKGARVHPLRHSPPSPSERESLLRVEQFVSQTQIKLFVRHVKGHRPGGKRQWVNRECDFIARHHMRQARVTRSFGEVTE